MPECRSWLAPLRITSSCTSPRSMMVMPGVVAFHMPVSQTRASAGSDNSALLAARNSGSDGEPVSSSPSNRKVTLHGSPPLASKARQASTKVMS